MTDLPEGFPGPVPIPGGITLQGHDSELDAQMLMALGAVIRAHSMLDYQLRVLYCALMQSKYASITAAGQMTGWLLGSCGALVKRRDQLTDDQRETVETVLVRAKAAAEERNRFVHDVWAIGSEERELMRGRRGSHVISREPITLQRLLDASGELEACSATISRWFLDLGPDAASYETQLRWEDFQHSLPGYEL